MKPKLFALLERRFREMFNVKPDIEMDEIIPVILKPLMDEAIAEMNASNINQLAAAMVYVIGMSIKQERENG